MKLGTLHFLLLEYRHNVATSSCCHHHNFLVEKDSIPSNCKAKQTPNLPYVVCVMHFCQSSEESN